MHVVCAKCGAINRVPESKSHTNAGCGKCKSAIYEGKPVALTDHSFFRYVEQNDLPIIVDFWASWCGPCKAMAPVFESVAMQSDGLLFAKVDTQEAQQIAAEAGIRSIPTLIFFHKGAEVDRMSGALNESQLKQWIMKCVNKLSNN
ncbi:thioredoxin TrxC [Agaribacter marinus]|uniref:Thioredoxin n=1 Tax=Agaribacter marinus TaxID=1431249 RepID=A0AA37T5S6_9ALTE|nr:thioredoxin TrxC [Agaribacter marinus]GLR72758.1 thiol disulfide reductase thioredoxin [Agaribacter marinus]